MARNRPTIELPSGLRPRHNHVAPATKASGGDAPYRIGPTNAAGQVDVRILSEIGYGGVTADQFCAELSKVTAKTINLRINSPGGDVFQGLGIFNSLARHPAEIITYIDGWAASIASVIAMAGDRINIAENAQLMIHLPFSLCLGSADDMRAEAKVLDNIAASIIGIYAAQSGGDIAKITEQVNAETWFTGAEAVAAGFADTMIPNKQAPKPVAKSDPEYLATVFRHMPADLRAALASTAPTEQSPITSRSDLERALHDIGLPRRAARKVAHGGWSALNGADDGEQEIDSLSQRVAAGAAELAAWSK